MHAGDAPSPGHLPRLVFFAFIGVTVLGILGLVCYSIVTGWVPLARTPGHTLEWSFRPISPPCLRL
jgi:hypothetical protein